MGCVALLNKNRSFPPPLVCRGNVNQEEFITKHKSAVYLQAYYEKPTNYYNISLRLIRILSGCNEQLRIYLKHMYNYQSQSTSSTVNYKREHSPKLIIIEIYLCTNSSINVKLVEQTLSNDVWNLYVANVGKRL